MAQIPADLTIRAATVDDLPAMTELINLPGFRYGTLRLPFSTQHDIARWVVEGDADRRHLVAETGGAVVGSAGLHRFAGRRAHAGEIGMGVHDLYVGQGIGTALLQALIDLADNWFNLRRIELTVNVDNAPAIALYERFGFEKEGRYVDYSFRAGAFVDAFCMARLRR